MNSSIKICTFIWVTLYHLQELIGATFFIMALSLRPLGPVQKSLGCCCWCCNVALALLFACVSCYEHWKRWCKEWHHHIWIGGNPIGGWCRWERQSYFFGTGNVNLVSWSHALLKHHPLPNWNRTWFCLDSSKLKLPQLHRDLLFKKKKSSQTRSWSLANLLRIWRTQNNTPQRYLMLGRSKFNQAILNF